MHYSAYQFRIDQESKAPKVYVLRATWPVVHINLVKQWKFEPAKKDGAPVAVQMNVEVNFRLY